MTSPIGAGLVNAINDDRRDLEGELVEQSPVYADFVKQMGRVYGQGGRPGGLDQTQRILMALAMAVHSGSQSSIEWTMTRALNHGASEAQIRDAMDVALLNGGTFAVANFRFAHEAFATRTVDARGSRIVE
jgi:alkylhydroperoxidase/carboxymuconolactone decarboxylase family protein YurZ